MVGFVVFLSNGMVVLVLMLLGYRRMIFVSWILHCWIATFPFTLRSRVLFNPKGMMGHGVGGNRPKRDKKPKSNDEFYYY